MVDLSEYCVTIANALPVLNDDQAAAAARLLVPCLAPSGADRTAA